MSGSIGTTTTTASGIASAASAARGAGMMGDMTTFLRLLTTQLKNQSPTDPLKTDQLTQQLVQFASVEQQTAMNQHLEQLVSLQQAAQLTAAAPLMGRLVEVEADRLALQDGVAALRLPPAGAAVAARITVTDSAGRTLREQGVALGSGRTTWVWDGRDSAGRPVADGAYRVQVEGVAATGAPAELGFTVLGTASAAERQDGTLKLMLGDLAVGFDRVRGVGAVVE